MKKYKKYLLGALFVVFPIILYINSNFYIKDVQWKYKDGFHIGDWVNFGDTDLQYRTIYSGKKAIAKIIFCYGNELIIENIETHEKGYYSNKG